LTSTLGELWNSVVARFQQCWLTKKSGKVGSDIGIESSLIRPPQGLYDSSLPPSSGESQTSHARNFYRPNRLRSAFLPEKQLAHDTWSWANGLPIIAFLD